MELVLELFLTVLITIIFSFVVAKLVYFATASDDERDLGRKSSKNPNESKILVEDVKFEGEFRVWSTGSENRVKPVLQETVEKVDQFEGERSMQESNASPCGKELVEERRESAVISDADILIERCDVVGRPEKSPEVGFMEDEVATETVGGAAEKGLCGLTFDEKIGRDELIEFDDTKKENVNSMNSSEINKSAAVKKAKVVNCLDEEDKIVENVEANDEFATCCARSDVVQQNEVVDIRNEEADEVEREQSQGNPTSGTGLNQGDEQKQGLGDDDVDDWEGIEQSKLQKLFAEAANYVAGRDELLSGNDLQMQFYGLHKVAVEGPCHEPQPMVLKVSSRAKWNAWQRLGNMSPDAAMEQYISLLSDKFPEWIEAKSSGDIIQKSLEARTPGAEDSDVMVHRTTQPNSAKQREQEINSGFEGGDLDGASKIVNKDTQ